MGELMKPPKWLTDALPEEAGKFLESGGWLGVLALFAVIGLFVFLRLVRGLFGGKKSPKAPMKRHGLEEDLSAIPEAKPHSGDLKMTVEGVPVRLRLVVLAPAGTAYEIRSDAIPDVLDRVLPGLAGVVERDDPVTRVWPHQLSTEGFTNTFHRNTPVPEGENKATRWVLVAGRADLGGKQVLVGLAMQSAKPTTVGRKTLKSHEWATALRVRAKEA